MLSSVSLYWKVNTWWSFNCLKYKKIHKDNTASKGKKVLKMSQSNLWACQVQCRGWQAPAGPHCRDWRDQLPTTYTAMHCTANQCNASCKLHQFKYCKGTSYPALHCDVVGIAQGKNMIFSATLDLNTRWSTAKCSKSNTVGFYALAILPQCPSLHLSELI